MIKRHAAVIALLVSLVAAFLVAPGPASAQAAVTVRKVAGEAHVQNKGWLPVTDGVIGTTGQSLRMEAVALTSWPVQYQVHVQDIGWMDYVLASTRTGTWGESLRMEAIRINLLPGVNYDGSWVEYRCHVQDIGWMPWVKNWETCGTTGRSLRLEAIEVRVLKPVPETTPSATPSTTPSATPSTTPSATPSTTPSATTYSFGVTADTGMEASGAAVLASMGQSNIRWVGHLGDMSYQSGSGIEKQWCDWVKARVTKPFQIIPGNHEAQNGDGVFSKYAACLPDRLPVQGDYQRGMWFYDEGPVRYITMSPMINLPQGNRTYAEGSIEYNWVRDWIRDGKANGRWIVAAMHVPCVTNGIHGCEGSAALTNMLVREGADVILAGHDHNYGRSHQVTGSTSALSVVDNDGAFVQGRGSVFVIVGNGGHKPREVAASGGVWAVSAPGTQTGWVRIDATNTRLTVTEVPVAGGLSDRFTVER